MGKELSPEEVLRHLRKGKMSPFYLFYGPSEFQLEKILGKIRETFIPESVRDFNLQVFYADQSSPADILDTACSLPFMSENRLIIVRRGEIFTPSDLERFLTYIERPVSSTCLIFISSKPDFKKKFYKKVKELGLSVNFKSLSDHQIVPWLKRNATEMGLKIDGQVCAYLQQIVGNRLRDLNTELEKIYLCYGDSPVGIEQVKELAIHSRIYTIFELMDEVSLKRCAGSLSVLNRFLEEEDREGVLRVIGMLIRQFRLLWQTLSILQEGGETAEVTRKLKLPPFLARKMVQESENWSPDDLERAFHLLYQTDGLLKSGSDGHLVLENLVVSLCV